MGSIVQNIDFGNRVTVHSGNSFWKEVLNMNSEFFHNWKWAFFPHGASCLCRWMAGNSHLPRIFIYHRFQSLSAVFSLKVGFAGRTEREDKKKRPKKTKIVWTIFIRFFHQNGNIQTYFMKSLYTTFDTGSSGYWCLNQVDVFESKLPWKNLSPTLKFKLKPKLLLWKTRLFPAQEGCLYVVRVLALKVILLDFWVYQDISKHGRFSS